MKIFHCDHCGQLLLFENTRCVGCGHTVVAYLPDVRLVGSLDADGPEIWRSPLPRAAESGYRLCQNYKNEAVCNWAVRADDESLLCMSCRITRVIPSLSDPEHRAAWYRLEVAKRRLLFTLIELGLPMPNRLDDPERGLTFEFLADADPGAPPVLTGHAAASSPSTSPRPTMPSANGGGPRWASPIGRSSATCATRAVTTTGITVIAGTAEIDEFRRCSATSALDYDAALRAYYQTGARAWTGRSGSSVPTRRRTRGRIGPKRGRSTSTWSTRSKPPRHAVCSLTPRRRDEPTTPTIPSPVSAAAGRPSRASDRQLVSADLRVEQPESRARARRRLPVRPIAVGDRQAEIRRRCRRPRESRWGRRPAIVSLRPTSARPIRSLHKFLRPALRVALTLALARV